MVYILGLLLGLVFAGPAQAQCIGALQSGNNLSDVCAASTARSNVGANDASNLTTGNLSVNRLNGGTGASASTYWRGDGTWAAASGGSGACEATTNLTFSGTPGFPSGGSSPTAAYPSQALTFTAGAFYKVIIRIKIDGADGDSAYFRVFVGDGSTKAEAGAVYPDSSNRGQIRIDHWESGVEQTQMRVIGNAISSSGGTAGAYQTTSGLPMGNLMAVLTFYAQDATGDFSGPVGFQVNGGIGVNGSHGAIPKFGSGTWYVYIDYGTTGSATVNSAILCKNPTL